jgi:hypothetical protein
VNRHGSTDGHDGITDTLILVDGDVSSEAHFAAGSLPAVVLPVTVLACR